MNEAIFRERYNSLNPEQKEAVDYLEGPLLVVAGPGSGKTELLSLRVAQILLKTDTDPRAILCLTFTNSAVLNLRERLISLIGDTAYQIPIFTFHGFSNAVQQKYPHFFYAGEEREPIDTLRTYEILEQTISELSHEEQSFFKSRTGGHDLKMLSDLIRDLKKENVSVQSLESACSLTAEFCAEIEMNFPPFPETFKKKEEVTIFASKIESLIRDLQLRKPYIADFLFFQKFTEAFELAHENPKKFSTKPLTSWRDLFFENENFTKTKKLKEIKILEKNRALAKIYQVYQEKLATLRLKDYEDQIQDFLLALERHSALRAQLQEDYLYGMIDEFQDTNNSQMAIVKKIFDNELNFELPNIMAVGDDDQAIYRFQGASVENILNFRKIYPRTKIIVLKANYRSQQEIIDLMRRIILTGRDRLENLDSQIVKDLYAANSARPLAKIRNLEFALEEEQFSWLVEEILRIKEQGGKFGEITILSRTNKVLRALAIQLRTANIPIKFRENLNLLEIPHIAELFTLMRFIDSIISDQQAMLDYLLPEILAYPFWGVDTLQIWQISLAARRRKPWLQCLLQSPHENLRKIATFFLELGVRKQNLSGEEILDYLIGTKSLKISDGTDYLSPYKAYYFSKSENIASSLIDAEYLVLLEQLRAFVKTIRSYRAGIEGKKSRVELNHILNFIRLHRDYNIPLEINSTVAQGDDAVHIQTVHSAKGLEYETVFILNCNDDVWEKNKITKFKLLTELKINLTGDSADDFLRLFYVAISRAKQNLYFCRHTHNEKNEKSHAPASYLTKLPENKTEKITLARPALNFVTPEYLANRSLNFSTPQRQLLEQKIKNYRLSVTHLLNFLEIPEKGPKYFFETNILLFPQQPSPSIAYGNAIHKALEIFFTTGGRRPPLEEFLSNLQKSQLSAKDFKLFADLGAKELPFFLEQHGANILQARQAELSLDADVYFEGIPLSGKIDRIHFDSSKGEIRVVDYKTGKPLLNWQDRQRIKTHEQIKSWQYRTQLLFYKILLENSPAYGKYRVTSGAMEFIKAKDGKIIILEASGFSSQEEERIKRLLKVVYHKISNLDFPDVTFYKNSAQPILAFEEDLLAES